jgi:hypothetical protein
MKLALCSAALFTVLAAAPAAEARSLEDCQLKWGQAARSYMNGKNTSAVEDGMFKPACELEASGDKEASRVEAVRAGAAALQKVDAATCERFLKYFIGIEDGGPVCTAASGEDVEAARKAVAGALPPAGKGKSAKKKGSK